MATKPTLAHRSPVHDLPRPEPRFDSAHLDEDEQVVSWLGRLYGGASEDRALHGLHVPFEHDSDHLNPLDVLVAFIEAARVGRQRNAMALEAAGPMYRMAG